MCQFQPLFVYFRPLHVTIQFQFWKKQRCCARDSNPGPQDCRCSIVSFSKCIWDDWPSFRICDALVPSHLHISPSFFAAQVIAHWPNHLSYHPPHARQQQQQLLFSKNATNSTLVIIIIILFSCPSRTEQTNREKEKLDLNLSPTTIRPN